MLCVLTNGMWLGDTHWHPVTSATPPLPLPRFLSKLECCWSRDWHSLTHLPQWPMNLSEPAEIMATPWRHCWTVGQDRKRLDWWRSQTKKKKLCCLSCRGSLVWFTGRWKVKLLLFNGTGYKNPIAGYIWVNFNNLEREKNTLLGLLKLQHQQVICLQAKTH